VLCANADRAVIVTALHPDPALAKLERLVAVAWESGAEPLIVLTKADLVGDAPAVATEIAADAPGVEYPQLAKGVAGAEKPKYKLSAVT